MMDSCSVSTDLLHRAARVTGGHLKRALMCLLLSASACSCEEEPAPTKDMTTTPDTTGMMDMTDMTDAADMSDVMIVPIMAGDDTVTLDEDTFQLFRLFDNDTGTGKLTLTNFGTPTLGSLMYNTKTQNMRFDPKPDAVGTETLDYTIEDEAGQSATASFTIVINPVNDPPTLVEDIAYLPAEGGLVQPLENDSDVEGDTFSLTSATPNDPRFTATVEGDAIRITPLDGFTGTTSLTYEATDTHGASATGMMTLGIGIAQGAPLLHDDALIMSEGLEQRIAVLSNDMFEPGGKVTIVKRPRWLEVSAPNNILSIRAPRGFNGQETVTYEYRDPQDRASQATVFITVYKDSGTPGNAHVQFPNQGLSPRELGIIINDADPASITTGEAYAQARNIPAENIVRVSLPHTNDALTAQEFAPLYTQVQAALPAHVQALAIAWMAPYRVDCMSITSAFTLGFDTAHCAPAMDNCAASSVNPIYNTPTGAPYAEYNIRPSMMLAGINSATTEALIMRGVASDNTFPTGRGYLIRTDTDSVRFTDLVEALMRFSGVLNVVYIDNEDGSTSNSLKDIADLLFSFSNLARVAHLETLTFLPGGIAGNMASEGGKLTSTSGPTNATRWLEAGATGSFGTLSQSCDALQKAPRVSVLLDHYYRGDTLVEAYWKSVEWPGEGVFVGEPLARPWGRAYLRRAGNRVEIESTLWRPGRTYEVLGASQPHGPYTPTGETFMFSAHGKHTITFPSAHKYYRVQLQPLTP